MATTTTPVRVPCPVCRELFPWPPTHRCARCHADLPGPVAAAFWQLSREEEELHARQADLWRQLTATATPAGTLAPPRATPAPTHRGRLTDLGAQTVLGLTGAALLTVAAVVFAAVTWQVLPTTARAAILVAAAGSSIAVALWLEGRQLAVTAGAVALLADALTGTVVWAVHTYGATGDLVDTGGGALAALGAVVVALGLGRRAIRWQPVAAAVSWVAAVLLASLAVVDVAATWTIPLVALAATVVAALPTLRLPDGSGPRGVLLVAGLVGMTTTSIDAAVVLAITDGPAVVSPIVAGAGAAALWARFGGRRLGTGAATAGLTGLVIGLLATVDIAGTAVMAGIAGTAAVVALVALLAESRRLPLLVGSFPVTVPAVTWTVTVALTALVGWLQQVGSPWQDRPPDAPPSDPWVAVMTLLTAGAVVLAVAVVRPARWRMAAGLAAPVAASAAVWGVGGSATALVLAAAMGAVAGFVRLDGTRGRASLVAWAVVAVGWSIPSPMLSTLVATAAATLALAARAAPVGRHVEQSALAVLASATAGAAAIVWLLGTAGAGPAAGPAAVAVAVAVAVAGRWLGLQGWVAAAAVTVAGVVGVAATAMVDDLETAALTSAILAAGTVALSVVWRRDVLALRVHTGTTLAAATATSALLLHAAEVTTPEAYTAVPATLALGVGTAWMVRDRAVRSRQALHPGLALAVGPTLILLLVDPQDTTRAVAAAILAAVALLVGVGRRVAAPVWHGAAAAVVVALTQLVVVAGHVPRWVTFATVGALLVAASATFERQRLRVRALRRRLAHTTTTYR